MIQTNPLVSVFIVTYNSQDYIIEALDSVKSQTYQNIELIVSDDGSNDNTIAKVKEWINLNKGRFVRTEVVETPVNTGIPANYNRAVKACNGEWLKMMDGDDMLLDNCVADNVNYVLKHTEASVVFSDLYLLINGAIRKRLKNRIIQKRRSFFELDTEGQTTSLLKGNILPSQTCFISAKLLKENPYDEKYKLLEDYPMWLKLSSKGIRFYYIDKCTAIYRIVNSVSSNSRELFPSKYTDYCKMFYKQDVVPLIKSYKAKEADAYNKRYFLWYDACRVILQNRRNAFTVPLCQLFRILIFNKLLFHYKRII